MPKVMIDDLLAVTETVNAEGQAEPLVISFVPCLPAESIKYQVDSRGTNGEARAKILHDLILAHVKTWDVQNRDGKIVPVESESLKRIPESYWWSMENIILSSANKVSETKKN